MNDSREHSTRFQGYVGKVVNILVFVKCFIEALNCSAWVSRDSTQLDSCGVAIQRVTSSILEQIPSTDTT